ncbi:hypothetical protein BDR05DRAFT_1005993 [Suillus weaverae]|nr:hypothetical protein BDR05DRAFT_1005993 [Suillus weaverae]
MLEDFGMLLVLADKALFAYHVEALVPSSPQSAHTSQTPQSVNGTRDVHFLSVGNQGGRTLVIYMKKKGLDSVFQFFLPSEFFDLVFVKAKIAIPCTKGFEIMDLTEVSLFLCVMQAARDSQNAGNLAGQWGCSAWKMNSFCAMMNSVSTSTSTAYRGASAANIVLLVLQFGKNVSPDDYGSIIVAPLVKLFASSDRGTRIALLGNLSDFAKKLDENMVDKIWPNLVRSMFHPFLHGSSFHPCSSATSPASNQTQKPPSALTRAFLSVDWVLR